MATKRADLERDLGRVVGAYSGTAALAAKHLGTGEEVLINAERPFGTASTFKLAVLAELFRQADGGDLDLNERVRLQAGDRTLGSGVLKELLPGAELTALDLAVLMIVVSDNTATNVLIDRVGGIGRVNRTMQDYGLKSIIIHNRIDLDDIGGDIRSLAEASALDMMRLMAMMVSGELVSPQASAEMLGILGRQQYVDQFPRYFVYNSYADELRIQQDLKVHNKTGFYPGTRTDTGAIRLPGGDFIAYAVVATDSTDRSMHPEAEPIVLNGVLGKLILDYWWPVIEPATVSTASSRAALEVTP